MTPTNIKKYSKYFDPWHVLTAEKTNTTAKQEIGIEALSKAFCVDPGHVRTLVKLAMLRNGVKYTSNEVYLDQMEKLYNALLQLPEKPSFLKAPIREINIKLHNGERVKISNELLITNLCYHAHSFLVTEMNEYVKPSYIAHDDRKKKGRNNSGKLKANKILMFKMLTFLESETQLQQKQIGSVMSEIFKLANNSIKGTGKSLYDTIKRSVNKA